MLESIENVVVKNPDLAFLLDTTGRVMMVNSLVKEKLGYTQEELIQKKLSELVVEDDKFQDYIALTVKGESSSKIRFNIKHQEEGPLHAIIKFIPIYQKNNVEFILLIIDVLKNDFIEEAENKLLLVSQSEKDIITILSVEGLIKYVSPACKKVCGYHTHELIGKYLKEYVHLTDFKKINQKLISQLHHKETPIYTYRFKLKNGTYIWKETTFQGVYDSENKKIKEVIAISRDITDKKRIEKILKRNEKRYRLIVEESPNAILVLKGEKWVFANKAAICLLGATGPKQIIDKEIYSFIPKQDQIGMKKKIRDLTKGKKVTSHEEKWIKLNGNEVEVEVIAYPTIYKDESAIQFIINDVTERKKIQQLSIISEKLKTAGQLAAGIAHEIRNPLTSLKGFLQLLNTDGKGLQYKEVMQSELERIEFIVSQLLASSKPNVATFAKIDLNALLHEVIHFLEPQALLHNVTLIKKEDDRIYPIYCDPNQIKQVLINIIKNGMEAMPNGGNIDISIKKETTKIIITISDSGTGIPEHLVHKIGQPFFTTKKDGTGLGMMVSFSIIKNHKGKISIESKEHEGTTFKIALPMEKH